MKIKEPYCPVCGKNDIVVDAFASWNLENQEWELHSTYENSKCLNDECEADESLEWRKVEVTFMLRWTTNGDTVIDGDERFETREEAEKARSLLMFRQTQEIDGETSIKWESVTAHNKNLIKRVEVLELHDGILNPK